MGMFYRSCRSTPGFLRELSGTSESVGFHPIARAECCGMLRWRQTAPLGHASSREDHGTAKGGNAQLDEHEAVDGDFLVTTVTTL